MTKGYEQYFDFVKDPKKNYYYVRKRSTGNDVGFICYDYQYKRWLFEGFEDEGLTAKHLEYIADFMTLVVKSLRIKKKSRR